jgi:hypothetical protein
VRRTLYDTENHTRGNTCFLSVICRFCNVTLTGSRVICAAVLQEHLHVESVTVDRVWYCTLPYDSVEVREA